MAVLVTIMYRFVVTALLLVDGIGQPPLTRQRLCSRAAICIQRYWKAVCLSRRLNLLSRVAQYVKGRMCCQVDLKKGRRIFFSSSSSFFISPYFPLSPLWNRQVCRSHLVLHLNLHTYIYIYIYILLSFGRARSAFVTPQAQFSARDIAALRQMTSSFSSPLKPIREQNLQFAFTFSKRIIASITASYRARSYHHHHCSLQDSSSNGLDPSTAPSSSSSQHDVQRPLFPLWLGLNPSSSSNVNQAPRPAPETQNKAQSKQLLSASSRFRTMIGPEISAETDLTEDQVTFSVK